jgi:triacylglycerol lipase
VKLLAIFASVYLGVIVLFAGTMTLWLWLARHAPRPARLWRAFFAEVGWAALVQLLLPLAFVYWPRRWRRPRAPGEVPVLMVHGYAQNRVDWYVLAWRLARSGRGSLFAYNDWPFGSIAAASEKLAAAVREVQAVTGAPRVHLIGHSMGGVVCRHYIERLDGDRHVASLIAVATPFAGTARIGLALGTCRNELFPGSTYLVHAGPPVARGEVRYHALWSRADAMVVPPSNASLGGAGPEHVLLDAGHLSLLSRRESADVVAAWLAA